MAHLNPALIIDCPRCGLPIYVLIEESGISVGTKADGMAEAFVTLTPIVQPHTCKQDGAAAS